MAKKITARFIIQIAGKPVENVDKALNLVLDKLKKESKKFKLIDSFIAEPELDEKTTLYNGFLEVSIKFGEVKDLLAFIVDYTPSSVEIEDPSKITLTNNELTGVLNDVSGIILDNFNKVRVLNAHVHQLHKKYGVETEKKK